MANIESKTQTRFQSIKLQRFISKALSLHKPPQTRHFEIQINQCVHYSAFRYGNNEYHPLESYQIALCKGTPQKDARQEFVNYLLHYRPRHMGEALGITTLSKKYPLWIYPWQKIIRPETFTLRKAWFANPDPIRDIMTHFSDAGILSFRIDREFMWSESALYFIFQNGYQPEKYTFVRTRQFLRADGKSAFLLLDGNHRVSALSALGYKRVKVEQKLTDIVREEESNTWYGVTQGFFTKSDALKIFHAYFEGNHHYRTTTVPTQIIYPYSKTMSLNPDSSPEK